jgi:hypothetical protein
MDVCANGNGRRVKTQLHLFSINKRQGDQIIEFRITVKEYATPNHLSMRFYAEADKETNQKTATYRPIGWGPDFFSALSGCVRGIEGAFHTGPTETPPNSP